MQMLFQRKYNRQCEQILQLFRKMELSRLV